MYRGRMYFYEYVKMKAEIQHICVHTNRSFKMSSTRCFLEMI